MFSQIRSEFHRDLDTFDILFPGREVIKFHNDKALQNFLHCQYPDWKEAGNINSIPAGRIPTVFLSADQMTEQFQDHFKALQCGEIGEINVYTKVMEASKILDSGVCIFPNIDGSSFQSKEAHVEIDLVVAHPKKGIFVFNIKNGIYVKERKLAEDMKRHVHFIRLLGSYTNQEEDNKKGSVQIPIHGIICSLQKNINKSVLETSECYEKERHWVLQPDDMSYFATNWRSIVEATPTVKNQLTQTRIEILVARLAAINSMDSTIAMLHGKITTGDIQRIKRPKDKNLYQTFVHGLLDNVDIMNRREEIRPKGRRSYFLWSKEQLAIINNIIELLLKSEGCRIIVTGPRGSGKTMLLRYIAKVAKLIFEDQHESWEGDVLICDGRMGNSQILFDKLKTDFMNSGIDVLPDIRMSNNLTKRKLLLVDEFNASFSLKLTPFIKENPKHIILFSSRKDLFVDSSFESYQSFSLTNTLRATQTLSQFIEKFRDFDRSCCELPSVASHNWVGGNPQCIFVDSSTEFIHKSLSTIMENLNRAKGLDEILVTPFIHPWTLEIIMGVLTDCDIKCEFVNPFHEFRKSNPSGQRGDDRVIKESVRPLPIKESVRPLPPKKTKVIFATGNHVDGAEYGAVVILLDRSIPHWWDEFIFDSLYIAMTRATTSLSLVINNTDNPPTLMSESAYTYSNDNDDSDKIISPPPRPAYSFVRTYDLKKDLKRIIEKSFCCKSLLHPNYVYSPSSLEKSKFPNNDIVLVIGKCDIPYRNRNIVRITRIEDFWPYLEQNILKDEDEERVSGAMVFVVHSSKEYIKLCNMISRHKLLFFMWEHQLHDWPLYILSPDIHCPKRKGTIAICDYLAKVSNLPPKV